MPAPHRTLLHSDYTASVHPSLQASAYILRPAHLSFSVRGPLLPTAWLQSKHLSVPWHFRLAWAHTLPKPELWPLEVKL